MENFWNILNIIILSFSIVICLLGAFYKHISFGWGLGDMFGYFLLYGVTILHLILTIYFYRKGIDGDNYWAIIFLIIMTFISLKATIWRGSEYKWNGSIFYLPFPKNIHVRNNNIKKELLVRMCSMEYNSDFTARWNGVEMVDLRGEIKIPNKLNKYIDFPINKILIQPQAYGRISKEITKINCYFDIDTLQLDKEYKLSGEITEVVDKKPVFKVKIKN